MLAQKWRHLGTDTLQARYLCIVGKQNFWPHGLIKHQKWFKRSPVFTRNGTLAVNDSKLREARLKKLSFRAWRRGFKEADIILGHFADERLEQMSEAQLDSFEILLEVPDQDLYGWIIERESPPPEHNTEIMKQLNQFYKTAYKKIQP